jgi:hypothetical protein
MTQRFTKGYVAYQRASGYNVVVIAFGWSASPRLKIKLPKPLGELGEPNPFPSLDMGWDDRHKEQWWSMPTAPTPSGIDAAIEIAAKHQPVSGPVISQ